MVVRGRVQGVFFRDTIRRLAESQEVAGWARNREDGALEAAFEGAPDAVAELVALCRKGPARAQVDTVEEIEEPAEGLEGFRIR